MKLASCRRHGHIFYFFFSEQFWKYAVIVNEEGHRLELYESEHWECIGKLRFHSADRLSNFVVTADPSARFLFLADYDAAVSFSSLCLNSDF